VARSLGPALPDALLARLMAPTGGAPPDTAILLATIDPYGWAHPALVSYAEVLALDAARLRLALHAGSRSGRHLRESGRATLVFADADLCLYVKVEAVALPAARSAGDLARFELVVRDVLEDRAEGEEVGARLATGLTIAWPGESAKIAERHARIRAALRD
jgi:Pyridoxamine 5'-phosphate oxidase